MKRGDIYLVDFEPSVGGEPARKRPAVIITNNQANAHLSNLVVAPVTTNVADEPFPFDVVLPAGTCGLTETSRIQLNYIRGLNRSRISHYVGSLLRHQVQDMDRKLRTHLAL